MNDFCVYDDAHHLACAAAKRFVELAQQALENRGQFAVSLAGGSTPRAMYELLASPEFVRQVAWSRVHVFWGDERAVPPDHADSNARMARETLLDRTPIPEPNIHRIRGELEPLDAAAAYERELKQILGPSLRFDLILLGMGTDGHTASIFPGSSTLWEQDRLVSAVYVEAIQAWRVTLTFAVINAARHVLLLISGSEKAHALARIRAGEPLPAALVQPLDGQVAWLVDRAAATP
jgi:6-phosphogluconolactonase